MISYWQKRLRPSCWRPFTKLARSWLDEEA
jgi:hypothetical protein